MKKRFLALLITFGIALCFMCMAMGTLDTTRIEYRVLRAEADEDSSTIDLTSEGNFANMPAGYEKIMIRNDGGGSGVNMMELVFCGGSAADKTFTYTIYAWRTKNGMVRMFATGTGTLGTQAVVVYPQGGTATSKYWADTLTVSRTNFKPVVSSDESGNNECASLLFDTGGFQYFYVEISSADGVTGNEAGDVTAYYSYF